MKNSSLLLSLLLFLQSTLFSQRVIEVSYIQDTKGNYIFSCLNRDFCNYVLNVEFTTLENAKSDHSLPYEGEVKPGANKLFTISPVNPGHDVQLRYKNSYRKGCLNPSVNPAFTYLLPIAPGKEAQAYILSNVTGSGATGPGAASSGPDSGYTIRLRMKQGDTIYASRRGIITRVEVGSSENDAGGAVTGSLNYIEIVHNDCSFGQYGIIKKDGAFVKPGQVVEAGTPIGLVGGDKYGRGSDVRFSVSYYLGPSNMLIPLQFWTKKNGKGPLRHGATYISEFPPTIVAQEKPKPAPKKKKA
ncbi:MAG TPA: M23 family metallopeptidase [Puia sp.]|nr:M23 family metallopeptidase [Puia sp.]